MSKLFNINKSKRYPKSNILALIAILMLIGSVVFISSYEDGKTIQLTEIEQAIIDQGEIIYKQNCMECHGENGEGHGEILQAPSLNGTEHSWHHADGDLYSIITNGLITMPSFKNDLSKDERIAVIKYFQNWWPNNIYEIQQRRISQNPIP
jgi:mono/diheme cytochrome c family protein